MKRWAQILKHTLMDNVSWHYKLWSSSHLQNFETVFGQGGERQCRSSEATEFL